MSDVATAVAIVVALWWASTGVILYLDGLPQRTHKWSLLAVALIGCAALVALFVIRSDATPSGALLAFAAGLAIWAVPTAAFYFGVVTGPQKTAIDPTSVGMPRFRAAFATVAHHEFLCLAGAVVLLLMHLGAANAVALHTYLLLWGMHLSGKFNMYFGVPNLAEEFLPPHLAYLTSTMRKRAMNLFFPLSVTAITAAVVSLGLQFWAAAPGSFAAAASLLLTVLALLALLEHWLLVLPVSSMALWTWSLKSRARTPATALFTKPAFESGQRND